MNIIDFLKGLERRVVVLVVMLLGLAALLTVVTTQDDTKQVTAHFSRAVSIYKGSEVRILGVKVGTVTAVIPEGNSVRVEMEYDAEYDLPADAQAVIVTPTLVADRFVQLTPVYTGGPALEDGAEIELADTGVPVELDRIYGSLQTLTRALGPNGVNADGTLDNFLKAARNAFEGQGKRGNEMLHELSAAVETFGEGAGPLFDTVTSLADFTTKLARNDKVVRAFMRDLAGVSRTLAEESDELQQAVGAVADAVGSVEGFVRDNRDALVKNVRSLTTVMSAIESERENLDTALRIAPLAMANLQMSFDHVTGSQNSRIGIGGNIWTADALLCGIVQQIPNMPRPLKDTACDLFSQLIRPLTTQLPFIPPEYDHYIPKPKDTRKGLRMPAVPQTAYLSDDDPSMTSLLGGVS
jgi:phospholipid/cholesterol/gamma-HCH transport system substrate-binding protein